jgi:hypothetical protein
MFFQEENNLKALNSFLFKAGSTPLDDSAKRERLNVAVQIIEYIQKFPEDWDARCTFNIKYVGIQFIQSLRSFDPQKSFDIDYIYTMAYRFLCEFDFLVGPDRELSSDLSILKNKVIDDVEEMDGMVKSQIIYASYFMPASIAKEFINDANIGVFRDFEFKKSEAETLKQTWDQEIVAKKVEVDELKNKLNEYKVGFNFVGLYQGFSELCSEKISECIWLFRSLIGMGVLMLAPLIVETIVAYVRVDNNQPLGINHLIIFLPLVSIEIILVYFFRVILINYKSVKGQVAQIELRKTLCQFIQAYADYSAKIKKQDSVVLEKFENIIFSGILSDPEKMPSTFDGLDQIVGLIKNIKST